MSMKQSTLERLQYAQASVSGTIETCCTTKKVKAIVKSLRDSHTVLASVIEHIQQQPRSVNKKLLKTRKSLVALGNTFQGLIDGVSSQDITFKEFRQVCQNVKTTFIPKLDAAVAHETTNLPPEELSDANDGAGTSEPPAIEALIEQSAPVSTDTETRAPAKKQSVAASTAHKPTLQDMLAAVRAQLAEVKKSKSDVHSAGARIQGHIDEVDAMLDKTRKLKSELRTDAKTGVPAKKILGEEIDTSTPYGRAAQKAMIENEKKEKQRDEYYQRENEQATNALTDLNSFKSRLPASLNTGGKHAKVFTMVRAPIVPLFDQWTMTQQEVLKRLAIPFIPLAGYVIFREQLLLIISRKAAEAVINSGKKVRAAKPVLPGEEPKPTKNKRMLDFQRDAQKVVDYANMILETINESSASSSTYAMVSDKFVANPHNQDLVCFWIMGTRKLSALIRSAGVGSAKVSTWGFPWSDNESTSAEVKPVTTEWQHPSDNPNHPDFLEYVKNKHLRPAHWKSSR